MQVKSIRVADALLSEAEQKNIKLKGWVRTRRDSKGFFFLELNDGSCLKNIQVLVDEKDIDTAALHEVQNGASVCVLGNLVASLGKGQKWEIKATKVELIGAADQDSYPLQKKRHSDEFLRTIAHLRPRTNKFGAALRLRSEIAHAVHSFFKQENFFYVHTPILTGADCEGAGEMFRVTTLPQGYSADNPEQPYAEDFFGTDSYLTVSGQLGAEALALALGKVYSFGPTFRAENSNTPRHAAEFWMIEPEVAFFDLNDNMQLGEDLTRYTANYVLENCSDDLALFNSFVDTELLTRVEALAKGKFQRISYREAIKILINSGKKFEYPVSFGLDLQTEHERFLAEEYFKGAVTVYNYPKEIKAFYMRLNDDNETVAAMDLLVPRIGELIGGSQREDRIELLEKRIIELGQKPEDYWWYFDLRRFGSAPHSGFGLGFERLLMLLTGINNIRDVIPFPRTPKSLEF